MAHLLDMTMWGRRQTSPSIAHVLGSTHIVLLYMLIMMMMMIEIVMIVRMSLLATMYKYDSIDHKDDV